MYDKGIVCEERKLTALKSTTEVTMLARVFESKVQ